MEDQKKKSIVIPLEDESLKAAICSDLNKNLIFVVVSLCLIMLAGGNGFGYSSPALKNLQSHPNPFHLTTEEESWIGSVIAIGAVFGALLSGLVMDKIGRQCSLIAGIVPFVFGCLIMTASTNFWMFLAGRFTSGVFAMYMQVVITAYVAEIAPSALRGRLQAVSAMANSGGVLLIYICGSVLPWNWLALIPAMILCVSMLMLQFVPESPRWLISRGYPGGAQEALAWLRGNCDVQTELTEITEVLSLPKSKQASISEFRNREIYKPLLTCFALWIFQVFSGVDYVILYTVEIFQNTAAFMDPYYQTILVGCSGFIGNLISLIIIDSLGRRITVMASGIAMIICLTLLGFFYRFQETTFSQLTWMPLVCLMAFQLSYSMGWGPVPSIITGELLPNRIRGIGGGLAVVSMCVSMFLEAKFSLILANSWIHQFGTFWIFAIVLTCGLVFVFFCLPETKGKSLEEIQAAFEDVGK